MCKADVIVIKVHVKGIAVVRCVNANITILSSFASSSSLFWFRLFVGILDVSPSAGAGFNWRTFFLRDVYLELFLRSVGRTTSWSQNIPNTNTWSVDDRYACLCLHICVFVCNFLCVGCCCLSAFPSISYFSFSFWRHCQLSRLLQVNCLIVFVFLVGEHKSQLRRSIPTETSFRARARARDPVKEHSR